MKTKSNIFIKNRKAWHEYFFQETFTAGIVLMGSEIKSIRMNNASLSDAYCMFFQNELYVLGMHIAEYKNSGFCGHQAKRNRKLLLTKRELKRLKEKSQEKGLTIIPTSLFINERGYAKLNIALAKGKHSYDKRESIKERDIKRDTEKSIQYKK